MIRVELSGLDGLPETSMTVFDRAVDEKKVNVDRWVRLKQGENIIDIGTNEMMLILGLFLKIEQY